MTIEKTTRKENYVMLEMIFLWREKERKTERTKIFYILFHICYYL